MKQRLYVILNEIGQCESRDRKRGCLFRNWLRFLLLTVGLRLSESWLTTLFFFSSSKGIPWNVIFSLSLLCLEFEKRNIIQQYWDAYNLRVFIVVHDCSAICWLPRRPTSQPHCRSRWPWWPHLMHILKNGRLAASSFRVSCPVAHWDNLRRDT